MPALLLGLLATALAGVVQAQGSTAPADCLAPREIHQASEEHRLVAPDAAVGTARHAVQGGDVLRASLCRDGQGLVYVIVALRKDGRVVQVTIDAPSGKLKSVR
jgi:uncharacterized membrane protein YkoI